ncbi:MAG TPA: TIGR04372 family glycosyltransferase, partial [Gammaproteobacteria bacterium]|nr:TIGR04372 family glycosyltransferase [Gammaproteobacteria bacterium]
ELGGFGQAIRNSGDLETYLDAIRYITAQGGWVIKLGGPKAPALPKMAQVIDYARSQVKSELLDLYLVRHARFFIGTTSGLTNVAISFNLPCALVNCASPDAQVWSSRVRFVFKPVLRSTGGPLNQLELTSTPWRWRMFNIEVLQRHDAEIQNNTADEILETVKEVHHLAKGEAPSYNQNFPECRRLLTQWKASLAFPEYYGAAQPSLYYLQKHAETFLLPDKIG